MADSTNALTPLNHSTSELSFRNGLLTAFVCAAGAGMGWGIRGQYGHETGAMIAGLLASCVLALAYLRDATSLRVTKAIALATMGVGLGGSMTYGQTVGLTHDGELIGHSGAYWWGMLGLFIKGGVWIGIMGLMLGMAFSRVRYRVGEVLLLMPCLLVVTFVGIWILNRPFDPATKSLPRLYFSDHWFWEPDKVGLSPRLECWGGLVAVWAVLTYYVYAFRGDRLARNMAWVGYLAGGVGFSGGQSIQALHAWYPDLFSAASPVSVFAQLSWLWPSVNWWNAMETAFGTIFGFILALGLWFNQTLVANEKDEPEPNSFPFLAEYVLLVVHLALLVLAEFFDNDVISLYTEFGVVLIAIPWLAVLGGRYFAYAFAILVVAVPIAGKTFRNVSLQSGDVTIEYGILLFLFLPLAVAVYLSGWLPLAGQRGQSGRQTSAILLLFATWFYFLLNFAFFRLPWPWEAWTGRTPHGLVFFAYSVALTLYALPHVRKDQAAELPTPKRSF